MHIQQVVKSAVFPYGNVQEGESFDFKFEFQETFDLNLIDFMHDSNTGGCNCFKWKVNEAEKTITGTMNTDRKVMGVLPRTGWNQKTNEIYIKLKTTPPQYQEMVNADGSRSFLRQENPLYTQQLLRLKVDGYINRKN